MPTENAQFVTQLDITKPTALEVAKEGDDHIRQLKRVIKQTFPDANAPVTVTIPTQGQAQLGTENTRRMTALRTKQAIDYQRPFATQVQALEGLNNASVMTPLRVKQVIDTYLIDHGDPTAEALAAAAQAAASALAADVSEENAAVSATEAAASAAAAAASANSADASADAAAAAIEDALNNSIPFDSVMRDATDLENLFNPASAYAAVGAAIKSGTCKIVSVGDSLMFGHQGPAQGSMMGQLARKLTRLFPNVAFTFIDKSIPGGRFSQFLDVGYAPEDSGIVGDAANTEAVVGTGLAMPGRDAWNTGAHLHDEVSYRWPGGASNAAAAWQVAVQGEAPDLLIFGLGLNDMSFDDTTLHTQRSNFAALKTLLNTWTKQPSVALATEHTGNPEGGITTHKRDVARGANNMARMVARYYNWGLIDIGRAYDRHILGIDPVRNQFYPPERYFDGVGDRADNDLWAYEALFTAVNANPIEGAGTAAVEIDTAGKHVGQGYVAWARKEAVPACAFRFNIRKLATENDFVAAVLSCSREESILGNEKMYVTFKNTGGVGKIALVMDGITVSTQDAPAPFPTDDTVDYPIFVWYNGTQVRVFCGTGGDPNVPNAFFNLVCHSVAWPGFSYGNAVAAPDIKITDFALQLGKETPSGVLRVTPEAFFGGPIHDIFTNNRSLGGDHPAQHPSALGQQLLYEQPMTPMIAAVMAASATTATTVGGVFVPTADLDITAAHTDGFIAANSVTPIDITLPSPATVPGLPLRFKFQVQTLLGGVRFVPADADSHLLAGEHSKHLASKYQQAEVELTGVTPTVYNWSIVNPVGGSRIRNTAGTEYSVLGAHYDEVLAQWIADAPNAVIIRSSHLGSYDLYVNAGLVTGDPFVPTLRFSLPVNLAGTIASTMNLAGPDGTLKMSLAAFNTGNCMLMLGAHHDGTNYIARATSAFLLFLNTATSSLEIYANSGLTVGNSFSPTKMLALTADGRLYGAALHNNANPVTGTTAQYVASGTYTPTLTNTTNVAASIAFVAQWIRVGNVVTVSGAVNIDPTAEAGATTILSMDLPIASDFTGSGDCAGCANTFTLGAGEVNSAPVLGDATNNKAVIRFQASDLTNITWYYHYTYVVK